MRGFIRFKNRSDRPYHGKFQDFCRGVGRGAILYRLLAAFVVSVIVVGLSEKSELLHRKNLTDLSLMYKLLHVL
jgi:hypothetical protein